MSYDNRSRLKRLINRDGTKCHYCGAELDFVDIGAKSGHTIDHIQPKSQGGTNALDNLVLACRSCNSSKGNRDYGTIIFKRDSDKTILFLMGEDL